MKRCFGYVRVSTIKQGEGVSLQAQRDAIQSYAAHNDIAIVRWFEEKVTAAKGGRPAFDQMMRLLRRGDADGLVVHKIDRSARNFADWAKIGELADAGIAIHFATETLDFRSRGGRLAADIQAVIAADYIRNLREEVVKGMYGRLKQGLYPWPAPIGYLNTGKGQLKAIDPQRAPLVQELFELYAAGAHSIKSLAPEMARRGLRNTGDRPISKIGIERILSNPFYAGVIKIRETGEVFEGKHQPLIDMALYVRAERVRMGRSSKKVTRHRHLFAGLFRCAHCNGTMSGERQKGVIYYRCHSPACPMTTTREDVISEAVKRALGVAMAPEVQAAVEDHLTEWISDQLANPAAAVALELRNLEARVSKLTDAYIDGKVDEQLYLTKKEELFVRREQLRQSLDRGRRPTPSDVRKFLELAKSLSQLYEIAEHAEKRQIIELATSNRTAISKSPSVEPQNWLRAAQTSLTVLSGAPYRSTIRMSKRHTRYPKKIEDAAKALIDAATSENAQRLLELKRRMGQPAHFGPRAALSSPTGSHPRTFRTEDEDYRAAA